MTRKAVLLFAVVLMFAASAAMASVAVSDSDLAHKLATKLAYDRTFQGNVFDWFTVRVDRGAVTLRGYAHNPMAHDSAIGLIRSTPGVGRVIDQTEILPVSLFDDQIRWAAARRIYGGTSFPGSMDPAHPIRIIVDNGHVKLEGVVLTELDKVRAGMIVNGMSGVFSVENDLEVKKG